MKSLVVYDSFFGNTAKIAQLIADELGAEIKKVQDAKPSDIKGLELLVVGSPTRAFRATPDIVSFINTLPQGALSGVKVAAFDTRIDAKDIKNAFARGFLGIMIKLFGYAANPILKSLVSKGGTAFVDPTGFCVMESEGPLRKDALDKARQFAMRCKQ